MPFLPLGRRSGILIFLLGYHLCVRSGFHGLRLEEGSSNKKNVLFLLSKATLFTVLPLERASFSCGWFSVSFSFSFFACAMWYFWVEASLLSSPVYMRQKETPENSLSFCSANSSVIRQSIFSPPFRILMFAFYILCSGILAILSGRNRKKHVFSFCMELDVLNDLREKVVH